MMAKKRGRFVTGERHGRHKLTEPKVMRVLQMLQCSFRVAAIARHFSVGYKTIVDIRDKKTWRYLTFK